jgi:MFS family permease
MSGIGRRSRVGQSAAGGNAARAARGCGVALTALDPRAWMIDAPDFWRLWVVGLVVFAVRWLEMLAVAVFAYQHTGSPFVVAALTMLRVLPMALFGAVIGALAERCERRTALIAVVAMMASTSLTLAVLAWAGKLAVWHLAVAAFCNGVGWTADNPVRRTMIGDAVGSERMSAAMSIDVGANNASQIVGPTVGGVLLATVGIGGAFAVSVACYSIALVAALRISRRGRPTHAASQSVLARMIEGLAVVRRNRRLIATLVITVIYNVFGWPATSMIPVIGHDRLGLGAVGIGVLSSMTGVGAFCGAAAIGLFVKQPLFWRVYLGGVIIYMLLVPAFALVRYPLVAGGVLLLLGVANACFSIMQATLVYLSAPAEMRSRVYGVLSVCIGAGLVGFIQIGWLAGVVGASWAAAATGVGGLVAMAATYRWWRPLAASV